MKILSNSFSFLSFFLTLPFVSLGSIITYETPLVINGLSTETQTFNLPFLGEESGVNLVMRGNGEYFWVEASETESILLSAMNSGSHSFITRYNEEFSISDEIDNWHSDNSANPSFIRALSPIGQWAAGNPSGYAAFRIENPDYAFGSGLPEYFYGWLSFDVTFTRESNILIDQISIKWAYDNEGNPIGAGQIPEFGHMIPFSTALLIGFFFYRNYFLKRKKISQVITQ